MKRAGIIMCLMCLLAFWAHAQQVNTTSAATTQQIDNSIKITAVDNLIKVSNVPIKSKLEIYNIVGSKVKEIEIKQSTGEYPISLPKGYYIVRIDGGIVRKIVIR